MNETTTKEYKGDIINFVGFEGKHVYNPTPPLWLPTQNSVIRTMVCRVEPIETEFDSNICFTEKIYTNTWRAINDLPIIPGQDPSVAIIRNEIILSCVEAGPTTTGVKWHTAFYKGNNIFNLTKFAEGPPMMKDIRLIELPNGKMGVFTRPITDRGGVIGYIEIDSLDELGTDKLNQAKLLDKMFPPQWWGGANELHLLINNLSDEFLIGVIGHMATYDINNHRHYWPISFIYNPKNHKHSSPCIITRRDEFPSTDAKQPDLINVVFAGGITYPPNFTGHKRNPILYVGLSDTSVGKIEINDPFNSQQLFY